MQGNLQGSSLSKRRFFLLSRCYFLRYLNVKGEDRRRRRRLVPPKFLSPRKLYLVLSSRPSPIDERLLASKTLLLSRHIQATEDKISPR